ncbi:Pleiotropic negative transcriptional regulator [Sorochytrium milnesiophthora]
MTDFGAREVVDRTRQAVYRSYDDAQHFCVSVTIAKVADAAHPLRNADGGVLLGGQGQAQARRREAPGRLGVRTGDNAAPIDVPITLKVKWQEKHARPAASRQRAADDTAPDEQEPIDVERQLVKNDILYTLVDNEVTDSDATRAAYSTPSTVMCIMGQLHRESVCLCRMQLYTSGLLIMTPGFSLTGSKYRVLCGDGQVFDYVVEHGSSQLSETDSAKVGSVMEEISRIKADEIAEVVGRKFTAKPDVLYYRRIHVHGCIQQAWGFDRSDYLKYYLPITEAVVPDPSVPDQLLASYTQSSQATFNRATRRNEATFAFPLDLCLLEKRRNASPRVYFSVHAFDHFGRHFTLGYTYLQIPAVAGKHSFTLSCWRPQGSIRQQMREWFLGSGEELDDDSLQPLLETAGVQDGQPAVPAHRRPLNLFGVRTISTGYISVTLHVTHQSREQPGAAANSRQKRLLTTAPPGESRAIHEALERARARLEAIKAARATR